MTELIWEGKYHSQGRKVAPPRIALPFQTVETVNESAADRDRMQDLFASGRPAEWRNRLIWGDKKFVLPSLLDEFAEKVDLIYIDPPFDTGANFSYTATIPDDPELEGDYESEFVKEPRIIEQKAYRDTWGNGLDGYLKWLSDTLVSLRELLTDNGSLYLHLDWHVGHYAKAILGDVKGPGFKFERLSERREKPIRQQRRTWDSDTGTLKKARDLHYLTPADQKDNLGYRTQEPEALIERILNPSSAEGNLVLDCFCEEGHSL